MEKNFLQKAILVFAILISIIYYSQSKQKPNVIFLIVDDWGYHDLSLNGSKLYNTPNVDALAKQSYVFQSAYASYPRCVPSRYAIMSGTYPTNEDHGSLGSTPKEQNFAKQFADAGYYSFFVGKWHLGSEENSPKGMGFNDSFAAGEAGGTETRFFPFNGNRVKGAKGEKAAIEDVEEYGKPGDYLDDLLTKRTIEYIKANKNKPFMGVLAFYAVHTPIEAKEADIARNKKQMTDMKISAEPKYAPEGEGSTRITQNDPTYAGLVENTDENIGKIINALKQEGIYDNTIIVLTSDHGGLSTRGKNNRLVPTSNAPLRAGKGWMYEGGIRVPLLFKAPNVKPGVDKESIVLGMDVFPTITDLALNKQITGIDGKSLKNVMNNQESLKNRTAYWNSYKARPSQTGDNKTSMMRMGDYKLLQFVESGKVELYNVVTDIAEKNDLSAKMPEKTKEMLAALEQFKKERNVTMKANHKGGMENIQMEESPKKVTKKEAKKEAKKAERKAAKTTEAKDGSDD